MSNSLLHDRPSLASAVASAIVEIEQIRENASHLVSMASIGTISKDQVRLRDGTELQLSRQRRPELLDNMRTKSGKRFTGWQSCTKARGPASSRRLTQEEIVGTVT